jgi:hypothetical protein
MNGPGLRLTEKDNPPAPQQVESWIGKRAYGLWMRVSDMIELYYPGVFTPQWLYGGKKHGWSLRYKKSRSFCTFIPEKDRFLILIVFGAEDRRKVESIRHEISAGTMSLYDVARTYHDGKWLLLDVGTDDMISDIGKFLGVKRKPKPHV